MRKPHLARRMGAKSKHGNDFLNNFAKIRRVEVKIVAVSPSFYPILSAFQIHGSESKQSLYFQICQPPVIDISHEVFFFYVGKDPFNHLLPHGIYFRAIR